MTPAKIFCDDFGNVASIAEGKGRPYKDAPELVTEYTLALFAKYDNNKMYFLSVYETEADAREKLKEFSCGTFKEIA